MLFQIGQFTGEQLHVAERTTLHDRSFDDRDDVPGQLAGIRSPRHASMPCRCLQVGAELLGHLVETLGKTFPKAGVAIAEGCTHVADDAASLRALAAVDHFLDRVQPPKDLLKRIGLFSERQFLLDRIEQLPALVHVPVQHREAQVFPVAELMEERALGHLGGAQDLAEIIDLQGQRYWIIQNLATTGGSTGVNIG